jgi:hypothetical protein
MPYTPVVPSLAGPGGVDPRVLVLAKSFLDPLAYLLCRMIYRIYTSGHTSAGFLDDREGVRGMLGRENTGAALCSGAVDDDFWALVCEDEEWLQAEFDAIVSEPRETPVRSSGRPSMTAAARPDRAAWQRRTSGTTRPWRTGNRPGRRWRRERSPPDEAGVPKWTAVN